MRKSNYGRHPEKNGAFLKTQRHKYIGHKDTNLCLFNPIFNPKMYVGHKNTNLQNVPPMFCKFVSGHKTVRIEIKGTEFGGTFYYNRTDHVFFQSLGEKNEKLFFVTRNRGDTMGVSGHGIFFRLWAVCARSNRWCALIGSWVTPPTTGAMKIERGVVYSPTIHHG